MLEVPYGRLHRLGIELLPQDSEPASAAGSARSTPILTPCSSRSSHDRTARAALGQGPRHPSAVAPTRARHVVTVFAATLAVITYIDRVCISQAAPDIRQELGLSAIQMGWAFTASSGPTRCSRSPAAPGRPPRPPPGADADRGVVVVLHRRDRLDLEPAVAAGDAVAVRRGRSRLLPEPDPRLHHLAAGARARTGPGHPLAQLALGRRVDAAHRRLPAALHLVAPRLRAVRARRRRLGGRFLFLVPRRPEHPPRRQPRPSWRCCRPRGRPPSSAARFPGGC